MVSLPILTSLHLYYSLFSSPFQLIVLISGKNHAEHSLYLSNFSLKILRLSR